MSVPTLLYGIHVSTDQDVIQAIQQSREELSRKLEKLDQLDLILIKLHQQSELIVRNFTRQWNLEMQHIEVECPNTFCLMPGTRNSLDLKNWFSTEFQMYLICQHPPEPHIVGKGYELREPETWWVQISPWLNHLIQFLKFGVPMGKAIGAVYDAAKVKQFEAEIGLMEEISKNLPQLDATGQSESLIATQGNSREAVGPALRALHSFLKKADPTEQWGGLYKILTPDGNILWLCDEHRKPYIAQPLVLPDNE